MKACHDSINSVMAYRDNLDNEFRDVWRRNLSHCKRSDEELASQWEFRLKIAEMMKLHHQPLNTQWHSDKGISDLMHQYYLSLKHRGIGERAITSAFTTFWMEHVASTPHGLYYALRERISQSMGSERAAKTSYGGNIYQTHLSSDYPKSGVNFLITEIPRNELERIYKACLRDGANSEKVTRARKKEITDQMIDFFLRGHLDYTRDEVDKWLRGGGSAWRLKRLVKDAWGQVQGPASESPDARPDARLQSLASAAAALAPAKVVTGGAGGDDTGAEGGSTGGGSAAAAAAAAAAAPAAAAAAAAAAEAAAAATVAPPLAASADPRLGELRISEFAGGGPGGDGGRKDDGDAEPDPDMVPKD